MLISFTFQRLAANLPARKRTDGIERLCRRLYSSDVALESCGIPIHTLEPASTPAATATLDVPARVIQEDFVVADIDANRGQA